MLPFQRLPLSLLARQHSTNILIDCNRVKPKLRKTYKVIMVRHGMTEWTRLNLFTGWYDCKLSKKGYRQAVYAGKVLMKAGFKFDVAFTSIMQRSTETLKTILETMKLDNVEIHPHWRLNERHYGALTGLEKKKCAKIYGVDQLQIWRRSFDVPPPPMTPEHPLYETIKTNPAFAKARPKEFPLMESLEQATNRTIPYWQKIIVPKIKQGKSVLIVAHGNSLRGIVQILDKLSKEEVMKLNIAPAIPFYYIVDENMTPIRGGSLNYLGTKQDIEKAIEKVIHEVDKYEDMYVDKEKHDEQHSLKQQKQEYKVAKETKSEEVKKVIEKTKQEEIEHGLRSAKMVGKDKDLEEIKENARILMNCSPTNKKKIKNENKSENLEQNSNQEPKEEEEADESIDKNLKMRNDKQN